MIWWSSNNFVDSRLILRSSYLVGDRLKKRIWYPLSGIYRPLRLCIVASYVLANILLLTHYLHGILSRHGSHSSWVHSEQDLTIHCYRLRLQMAWRVSLLSRRSRRSSRLRHLVSMMVSWICHYPKKWHCKYKYLLLWDLHFFLICLGRRFQALLKTYEQLSGLILDTLRIDLRCRAVFYLEAAMRHVSLSCSTDWSLHTFI